MYIFHSLGILHTPVSQQTLVNSPSTLPKMILLLSHCTFSSIPNSFNLWITIQFTIHTQQTNISRATVFILPSQFFLLREGYVLFFMCHLVIKPWITSHIRDNF